MLNILRFLVISSLFPGYSHHAGLDASFPTEQQVTDHVRAGMTSAEIVKLYGEPTVREPQDPQGVEALNYFAPLGQRNSPREGYCGFQVLLKEGKVQE